LKRLERKQLKLVEKNKKEIEKEEKIDAKYFMDKFGGGGKK